MLHDRRQRDREGPGKLAYRNALMLIELRQQSAPRGIGEGGERAIERAVLILNHVVKYSDGLYGCQPEPRSDKGVAGDIVDRGCGPFYGPASFACGQI
jgi:hypothetical protein